MISKEIRDGWEVTPNYKLHNILSLESSGYPAWTVKMDDEYGVALLLDHFVEVSEHFAGARLYSQERMIDGKNTPILLLTTQLSEIKEPFSTLCSEFVEPGVNGFVRQKTLENPIEFWQEWKAILGNKNIESRVYDVLGELQTLKYLYEQGITSAVWRGPDKSTYDIDCGNSTYYEVKSSVVRSRKEITMHNIRQADSAAVEALFIMFCQYEADSSGDSINSLVEDLNNLGYSALVLNQKLAELGFEKGQSARERQYKLISMIKYTVNDKFPAITEQSFKGDAIPLGITGLSYTVSLDDVEGEKIYSIEKVDNNELL